MDEQEILKLETGTKEAEKLKPKQVKIVKVEIELVGEKGNKKASFHCKHPNREELIKISEVKYEQQKGKLKAVGTWINLDEDDKLRKGSALANLLSFLQVKTLKETENKEMMTSEDEQGFLCFKAY